MNSYPGFRKELATSWRLCVLGISALVGQMTLEVLTEEDGFSFYEILLEGLEFVLAMAAIGSIVLFYQRARASRDIGRELARDLEIARKEGEEWRKLAQNYIHGLGTVIEKQFQEWEMTDAEVEVGLLMLKGFSHGELAAIRGTADSTARQQARAIFQKAKLPNRTAFCAYFLEDLLPGDGEQWAYLENPEPHLRHVGSR